MTVVTAVADVWNVDPAELPPLYHAVDPDALDRLLGSPVRSGAAGTVAVRFTFAGCDVVVDGDRRVTVTPPESGTERVLEA